MTPKCILYAMVAGAIALRGLAAERAGSSEPVQLDIERVWSAHPVGFCLLTHPPFQFVAYYDAERRMSIAQRQLDSTNWTITRLPSMLGWDSHNYVTMATDRLQVSDWKGYRWTFGGGGTIVVEVKVGAVRPLGEGRLALSYSYPRGTGIWVLDESSLRPIPGATAPREEPLVPRVFAQVESTLPGLKKQIRPDTGQGPSGTRFAITWETLESNRDRPRSPPWPEPSMLRVIRTGKTQSE